VKETGSRGANPFEVNPRRLRSGEVLKIIDEKYVLGFFALLLAIIGPGAVFAQDVNSPAELILQPQALEVTGIYELKSIDQTLTGAGVRYAVICRSFTYIDGMPQNDYRPDASHNCFLSSQFTFYQNNKPWGVSPHSTAICSILFGEDGSACNSRTGPFYYLGVVPRAKVDIYEFWYFLKNNVYYHIPPDADIITASFGQQSKKWWTQGLESLAEQYGLIIVAGIGNGTNPNTSVNDPVLYPAAGSNAIGVGVVDSVNTEDLLKQLANFSLAYPDHSSTGPTSDGRCKPDIVAPGNCMAADIFEPNRYEPTGNWSSFSTPVVAGAIGLLVQKAKEQPDLSMAVSPYGGNCVIKAILLNSATKLPFWHKGTLRTDDDHLAPLDYIQGAGMLNARGAYDNLIAGRQKPGLVSNTGWDLSQLDNKVITSNVYQITIDEPNDKYITATLSWNRHFEKCYPFDPLPEKNCDLRLEIWAVDTVNPGKSYMLDCSDSPVDNIEHIYCPADPNCTQYEIVLSMNTFENQNPDTAQRYGLAWNVGPKPDRDNKYWYDLNADGAVDKTDFDIMLSNRLNSLKASDDYIFGDINLDGQIRSDDFEPLLDKLQIEENINNQAADSISQNQQTELLSKAD
jgi:hypothetical protein